MLGQQLQMELSESSITQELQLSGYVVCGAISQLSDSFPCCPELCAAVLRVAVGGKGVVQAGKQL